MLFRAIIHDAEEGGYWAEVPVLPGCFTEGDTLEEIKQNLKEAISGILDQDIDLAALKIEHAQVVEIEI
jgi:predicted RNase H-like HicB family nuclease